MNKINQNRRKWLSLGGIMLGASILPNKLLAVVSAPAPKLLNLRNINTGEQFSFNFSSADSLSAKTQSKLNYLLRDKRSNQIHRMDTHLYTKFHRIQTQLGLRNTEIQIICGYRSPSSNAAMHRRSRGVASNSYHMRGQAIDFRIDGMSLAKIRKVAEGLNSGGVGYYPKSNFVHVDTGPVRTWKGA